MSNNDSHPTEQQLAAFIDGECKYRAQVSEHLDGCPKCADLLLSVIALPGHTPKTNLDAKRDRAVQLNLMRNAVARAAGTQASNSDARKTTSASKGKISQWGVLGALGGLLAGNSTPTPVPALGNHDPALPEDERHPETPQDEPSATPEYCGEEESESAQFETEEDLDFPWTAPAHDNDLESDSFSTPAPDVPGLDSETDEHQFDEEPDDI